MRLLLSMLLVLVCCGQAAAQDLCPDVDKQPTTEGKRMSEDTFEVPTGLDAADKLQGYLNQDTIAYDFAEVVNSAVVKGVILREQALATRTAADLAKAQQAGGKASADDVAKADAEAKKGLDAFCAFMANAVVAE